MSILGFLGMLVGAASIVDDVQHTNRTAGKRQNAKLHGDKIYYDSRGRERFVDTNEECWHYKHPTADRWCYVSSKNFKKVVYDPEKEHFTKLAKEEKERCLKYTNEKRQNALKNGVNNIHVKFYSDDGYDEYEYLPTNIRYKVYYSYLMPEKNKKQAESMEKKYGPIWVEWSDYNGRHWQALSFQQSMYLKDIVKRRYSIDKVDILLQSYLKKIPDVKI